MSARKFKFAYIQLEIDYEKDPESLLLHDPNEELSLITQYLKENRKFIVANETKKVPTSLSQIKDKLSKNQVEDLIADNCSLIDVYKS